MSDIGSCNDERVKFTARTTQKGEVSHQKARYPPKTDYNIATCFKLENSSVTKHSTIVENSKIGTNRDKKGNSVKN